jgi:HEAT repeat protein
MLSTGQNGRCRMRCAWTGVEEQISALEDPDPAIRIEAADALAMSGDRRAVWPLIRMLVDLVSDARYAAASALGCLADARATPQLVEVLRHDRGRTIGGCHVKAAAAQALGYVFDEQAIEPLMRALGDRHPEVGEAAALALSYYGPRIVPFLAEAMHSDNTHMRQYALLALKQAGNVTDEVQERAVGLLRDTSPAVRLQAVEYLRRARGPRAVEPLIATLRDDSYQRVRRGAALALGEIGDSRALEALEWANEHDRGRDQDEQSVRWAAQIAIAWIRKEPLAGSDDDIAF